VEGYGVDWADVEEAKQLVSRRRTRMGKERFIFDPRQEAGLKPGTT
jgi:hypothetical protein